MCTHYVDFCMVHTLYTIATRHVIINPDKNYQMCPFHIQKVTNTHKCKGFKQQVPFDTVRDYAESMCWEKTGSHWCHTGGIFKHNFGKIFISNGRICHHHEILQNCWICIYKDNYISQTLQFRLWSKVNFVQWYLQGVYAWEINLTVILLCDETLRKTCNKSYLCACHEGIWWSGDIAPQILNLGTT